MGSAFSRPGIEERLDSHRTFWNRGLQPHPVASFRIGDFFFARHFEAAHSILIPNKLVASEMLDAEAFLPDYERMFRCAEELGQEAFWTAEPYTGIPWMEAILGCEVRAGAEAFSSRHAYASPSDAADAAESVLSQVRANPSGNPWLAKYLEFTKALVELSRGRFPVGQPIMRGPTDMVGAMIGQTEMIFALADEPDAMRRLIGAVTGVFLEVIAAQKRLVPPFFGGTAFGFYHVWTPGNAIWFQDDLSSVLSPSMYREFFLDSARLICSGYEYTAVHLHPSSFFIVDDLIGLDRLQVLQVNKDVGGPSVEEMLPVLSKILEKQRLILWGDLTIRDLELVKTRLPQRGVFLNIVAPSLEEARELQRYIRNWRNGR